MMLSCAGPKTTKITPNPDMKYFIQIKEGETATIEWDFENAHRVKIEGYAGSFLPEGSIKVHPDVSKEYKLTAYKGFTDSLDWTVYVEVISEAGDVVREQKPKEVKPGETILTEPFKQPSYVESEFVSGIVSRDVSTGPDELRIVRVKYDKNSGEAEVYALLMDKLGNFISGYGEKKDEVAWNCNNTCGKVSANYSRLTFEELPDGEANDFVDFVVLIDNSGFSSNGNIAEPLKTFIRGMNARDMVAVSAFNQSYLNIFKLTDPQTALLNFDDLFILPPEFGFNATNEALGHSIELLETGKNRHRALVLVAYADDNASFDARIDDVIRKANLSNVTIFVIGIGDNVDSYRYRYLCSATGGKYYILLGDEVEKFNNVLAEILFTYRNSYKVNVPLQTFQQGCRVSKTKLYFSDKDKTLSANITFPAYFKDSERKYIIAAGFDTLSLTISSQYHSNLDRIANYIKKQNSKFFIIGHSFNEGDEQSSRKFARLRAEAVRDYLVAKGVNPDLLVIQSVADDLPLYTYTENPWMKKLNRRVELTRFVPGEKRDYELIAAFAPSEVESQKIIQKWEKRGYNAYFVRTLTHNGVAYKVKIWGFDSKKQAENAINTIKRKYKEYLILER
jgi:outer membrane protein OmpA-like peptidoglycan-associated protein